MRKDPAQLLRDLRALDRLFSAPEKWTKKAYARVAHRGGEEVSALAPEARCFCLAGGCRRVAGSGGDRLLPMFDALATLTPQGIVSYNDAPHRRFSHIKSLIARAIKAEQARMRAA